MTVEVVFHTVMCFEVLQCLAPKNNELPGVYMQRNMNVACAGLVQDANTSHGQVRHLIPVLAMTSEKTQQDSDCI